MKIVSRVFHPLLDIAAHLLLSPFIILQHFSIRLKLCYIIVCQNKLIKRKEVVGACCFEDAAASFSMRWNQLELDLK